MKVNKVHIALHFWLLITLTALAAFENSNKICISDTSKEHQFEIFSGLSTWLHKNGARSFVAVPHRHQWGCHTHSVNALVVAVISPRLLPSPGCSESNYILLS